MHDFTTMTRHDYVPTPTDDDEDVSNRWGSWAGTPVAKQGKTMMEVKDLEKKDRRNAMGKIKSSLTWAPRTGEDGGWKPLSMSMPILSALLLFTLLLIAAVELLAQESQKKGGLALSPTLADIPQVAMISYQYAPQVVAVVYSLIWSWVDLDIKRMQPWFELSKPEGASAQDSILLDYPYTFIGSAPFIAARRKHWLVFLSGTAMLVVFWALTPLQTSHMGTGLVYLSAERAIVNQSHLRPPESTEPLGPGLAHQGYATGWLNQPLPPFMTAKSAFLPFYLDEERADTNPPTNWTASTTRLFTELKCWPAEIQIPKSLNGAQSNFLDGRGCNFTLSWPNNDLYGMLYIPYWSSPYSEYFLADKLCPATNDSVHTFLALWTKKYSAQTSLDMTRYDINALYCQPSYYKQQVEISVHAANLQPNESNYRPISEREELSDNEFNRTAFEWMIAHGMPEEMKERDYPDNFVVEQHPQLLGFNLSTPSSNMVGFALAGKNRSATTIEKLRDPGALHQIFEEAHQYLFSLAVDQLLVNTTTPINRTATSSYTKRGIIVSRAISAALEGVLGFVAISIVLIMWLSSRATSNLPMNPSSLFRIAKIVRGSPHFLNFFCSIDNADERSLLQVTQNQKFGLVRNDTDGSLEMVVEPAPRAGRVKQVTEVLPQGYYEPIKPFALQTWSAILFITSVSATIGGLAYLKWAETKYIGLDRPSSNFEVQQILEGYIPAIIATCIEPFWILVTRLLCVLQPFKDLWQGNVSARPSIDSTYASIPPQFIAWRALKSKHFTLALICSAVFLANILTVSLPAVFTTNEVIMKRPATFHPTQGTTFSDESFQNYRRHNWMSRVRSSNYHDHGYVTAANITSGTPLPPWISAEYFFQPLQGTGGETTNKDGSYSLTTRGFGANVKCTPHPTTTFPSHGNWSPDDGCEDPIRMGQTLIREEFEPSRMSGLTAKEYLRAGYNEYVDQSCQTNLTLGWARTKEGTNMNGTIEGSFLTCHPTFQTAMFEVQVDSKGYILSYHRTSPLEQDLGYQGAKNLTEWFIVNFHQTFWTPIMWHNNTLTRDWFNHLYVLSNGSRAILDPNEPVPDPEELRPTMEIIYKRLFALLLGLNPLLFDALDAEESIEGYALIAKVKLFLVLPAWIVSVAILALNIGFAVILYSTGMAFVLPRMPTTIGSIVAYIAPGSLIMRDSREEGNKDDVFSFGRYIGRDGRAHIGIDVASQVVPIDPDSLGGKLKQRKFRLSSRKRQQDPELLSESGTWL